MDILGEGHHQHVAEPLGLVQMPDVSDVQQIEDPMGVNDAQWTALSERVEDAPQLGELVNFRGCRWAGLMQVHRRYSKKIKP